ncbi:MAG: metallophosphoesterase [Bacteroidota bacterium]
MTLLLLTDLHLFADPDGTLMGWPTAASFEDVLASALADHKPDAILLTGDVTQDGAAAAYARLAMRLRVAGCPCLWLPGNHDAPATMATAFAPFPWMRRSVLDLPPSPNAQWRIIALDTSTPDGDHGVLPATELQRFDAALRAAPDRPTLVALHHQPLPVGAAWLDAIDLHDADAFWRVVDRHPQVRGVVFGHTHQAFDATRTGPHGGVRVLGTPATCFQFAVGTLDFGLDARDPGYRVLDLGPDGAFTTAVHRVAVAARCAPTAAGYSTH